MSDHPGDLRGVYDEIMSGDTENHPTPECPAWADGRHCYETIAVVMTMMYRDNKKSCACGSEVKRVKGEPG